MREKVSPEEGFGNPVAFAHTIIDWYALSTGDLLHGAAEVSREGHQGLGKMLVCLVGDGRVSGRPG
jgi:hypothetical protein